MAINLKKAVASINRAVIITGSLSAVSFSSNLYAQDSAIAEEEVLVTGIRRSLLDSINTKRMANSVVDAISAEDIGKFPDKNVAESLARIPGIAISRDFGEGQGVTIRGLAPGFNITLMNGQSVGTAQWFVLSEAERNFNFEMLSSEMIAGVNVYKSAQADIDEGGLGGTVNLLTRKPLDLDANTIRASVDAQYSDLPEKTDPSLSGLYSWKNDDNTLGALVALSHQQRTVRREGTELFPAYFGPNDRDQGFQDAFSAPSGASSKGYIPWGVGSALFQQDRERNGLDLTLQWRPNDAWSTTAHYFKSELKADNQNQNFIAIPFRGIFAANNTSEGTVENTVVTSLAVDGGDPASWANHMAYDHIFRDGSSMETEVMDVDVHFESDQWRFHGQLGTTTGEGQNNDEFYEFWAYSQDTRANFDFSNSASGDSPSIDYTRSPWLTNPDDEMLLTASFNQSNRLEDTEDYLQADFTFDVVMGAVKEIKFGGKYRDRAFSQTRYRDVLNNGNIATGVALGTAGEFQSGTLTIPHDETSHAQTQIFDVNRNAMAGAFNATAECGSSGLGASDLCVDRDIFDAAASFEIEEQITALYAMANFEEEHVRGNVGIRYVSTDTDSSGYDLAASDLTPTKRSGEYSEFLPSLNIVWDLSDEALMRFAAGKALSRPAPYQLTSAVNLTPETSRGTSGNPDLKPLIANQFELGVEWYFADFSLLSGTVFKKDIKDFIFETTSSAVIDGVEINALTRPENGPSATLEGIELMVQHTFDNGFGALANYTYTDAGDAQASEAALIDGEATLVERNIAFPFASKDSYNLTGFYENDLFSARLNYSYRSEFFKSINETGEVWGDAQQQLDTQISYNVMDNLTLRFEALNLTNETIDDLYRTVEGLDLTASQFYNGRRFLIGASFSF